MDKCEHHDKVVTEYSKLVTSIAVMTSMLSEIKGNITSHIREGEKQGGYRDRLIALEFAQSAAERERKNIRVGIWRTCLVAGMIGGLLGKLTPEFFSVIAKAAFASLGY